MLAASRIVDQSDWLPMMMPTSILAPVSSMSRAPAAVLSAAL
jgi:hypothetical protein